MFTPPKTVFDYDFFDPTKTNSYFGQPLCFKQHEIDPMINGYLDMHKDAARIIKLLNHLDNLLIALQFDVFPKVSKEMFDKKRMALESEILNLEKILPEENPNTQRLITQCIEYCLTAISLQIKELSKTHSDKINSLLANSDLMKHKSPQLR